MPHSAIPRPVRLILCALLGMLFGSTAATAQQNPLLPDAPSYLALAPQDRPAMLFALPAPQAPSSQPAEKNEKEPSPLERGLKRGLEDQKQIYSAPFHRKNVKWDLLFLAGTGGLIALDKHASGALSPDHTNVSRIISDVGFYSTIGAVGLLGISSLETKDARARETAILGTEAFANTFVVYTFTQLLIGRQRPLEGNGNGDFWKNNALGSSFPSGHSSYTWTLASVVAHEYPQPWVQWLSYGAATTVSVTRFTGLKHFPSDVAVGAVFGYFIGQHIFHAHCTPGLSPSCHKKQSQPRSTPDIPRPAVAPASRRRSVPREEGHGFRGCGKTLKLVSF